MQIVIIHLRNWLKPDIVEAVECLHWWLGMGKVDNVLSRLAMDDEVDG